MLELVSSVGTPEGVSAAVQNGATAVYARFGAPDSVKTPLILSNGDFARAAEFCRQRGVKIYAVIDYLPSDIEFESAVKTARLACRYGADALVVNDLGLARVLRRVVPDLPLFAGSLFNVHDLNGVKTAAAMGFKRVTLSKELSLDEIKAICKESSIEVEVAVHGPTCPSYSGFCHLCEVEKTGSSLHGICAYACRKISASGVKEDFPLTLKDTCLVSHLTALESAGVTAVRIMGSERRPEYTALVSDIYSRALRSGDVPDASETDLVQKVFSPGGLTDAWLTSEEKDCSMVAKAVSDPDVSPHFFSTVKKAYLNREFQHVPVWFYVNASIAAPIRISAADDRGNLVEMSGPSPELAFHQELTYSVVQTELMKTGGTPFYCDGIKCSIDKGIYLPPSDIGKLRDELLKELLIRRKTYPPRPEYEFDTYTLHSNSTEVPALTVSVSSAKQLSEALADMAPTVLYIPLWEISKAKDTLKSFARTEGSSICAVLPGVIRGNDVQDVTDMLLAAKALGISEVLVSNFSHILFARSLGFKVRCDFPLNVTNSRTMGVLDELGVKGVTLPFTMSPTEARALSKFVPSEMIVYGRLPLMLTENCIAKASTGVCACENFSGLIDSDGLTMPIIKEYGCRNILLSARRLFLADNLRDYMAVGLSSVRLSFTTESAAECALIAGRYLGLNNHAPVNTMNNSYGG